MPLSAGRTRQETPPAHVVHAVAARTGSRCAVGVPARLHPLGRSVFVNRTGPYEYLSYGFYNLSPEILALFVETCQSLGLRPCVYAKSVRLNRRDDVGRLLEHVGRKG
jgi:hypothetical protein